MSKEASKSSVVNDIKGSISTSYFFSVLESKSKEEISKVASTDVIIERLKQAFTSLQDILPHCGIYSPLLQLLKDELYDAVYSDQYTTCENAEDKQKPHLEKMPYFLLFKRLEEKHDEKAADLRNEIEELNAKLEEQNRTIQNKVDKNAELQRALAESHDAESELKEQLHEKDEEMERMRDDYEQMMEDQQNISDDVSEQLKRTQAERDVLQEKNEKLMKYEELFEGVRKRFDLPQAERKNKRQPNRPKRPNKKNQLISSIRVAATLEKQIMNVQAQTLDEYDQFVSEMKRKTMKEENEEEEEVGEEIDSRLSNFQRIVTDSMTELQLVRQERQLIELQLEQINKSAPAAGGDGKKEEHMKSELFEPQESILSKYSLMMYTSVDDGKTYDELSRSAYCSSCGFKTVICPHKVTREQLVIKLANQTTHLKLARPTVRLTLPSIQQKVEFFKEIEIPDAIGNQSIDEESTKKVLMHGLLKDVSERLRNCCHHTYPNKQQNFNGGISTPRHITYKQLRDVMEDLYANIIWRDINPVHDVITVRDCLYRMMWMKYDKEEISESATRDFVSVMMEHLHNDQAVLVLGLSLAGTLDGSVFRYIHTMADLINEVNWKETTDFRCFVSIVYPFLDEDETEEFVVEFNAFGKNKISKNIVFDYIVDSIVKNREPRFVEARTRLNLHIEKKNLQSSLTGAELKEILEIICPISNQKLVVQLVDESLLCVKSEQLNITRMSSVLAYIIFEKVWVVMKEQIRTRIDDSRSRLSSEAEFNFYEPAENLVEEKVELLTMTQITKVAEQLSKWQKLDGGKKTNEE